jgi:hypothetical protein
MNTLNNIQTQQVSGGCRTPNTNEKLLATFKVESSTNVLTGTTAKTFSPSHPEGMLVHLTRFDTNLMAPSDSLSEDEPLFPGLNDQGGTN